MSNTCQNMNLNLSDVDVSFLCPRCGETREGGTLSARIDFDMVGAQQGISGMHFRRQASFLHRPGTPLDYFGGANVVECSCPHCHGRMLAVDQPLLEVLADLFQMKIFFQCASAGDMDGTAPYIRLLIPIGAPLWEKVSNLMKKDALITGEEGLDEAFELDPEDDSTLRLRPPFLDGPHYYSMDDTRDLVFRAFANAFQTLYAANDPHLTHYRGEMMAYTGGNLYNYHLHQAWNMMDEMMKMEAPTINAALKEGEALQRATKDADATLLKGRKPRKSKKSADEA